MAAIVPLHEQCMGHSAERVDADVSKLLHK